MKKVFAQAYLYLLLAMLYAPLVFIAVFSFTESRVLGNWTGFSPKLYVNLFTGGMNGGSSLLAAVENTLLIALVSAAFATLLGTIAAIGIHNLKGRKRAGMQYIVNPGVNYPKTLAEAEVICKYLNKVGEMVNAAGMRFGYHNHSHEFGKVEGKVWYDYMLEHTDADKVFFEMDVYWAVRGQVSPVEYFKKYPGRFTLLHIKDHREFGESGMVGFDAIFNNAETAGLRNLVVELEGSNRPNILDGMRVCADYLKAAKFVKPSYAK